MVRRNLEGACPRAPAVTCVPPEVAPCLTGAVHVLTARVMKLHGDRSVGVLFYPTAARAAPWGVDGEPPGGRRAARRTVSTTTPGAACATCARSGGRRAAWTVPRERSFALRRGAGDLHTRGRGEDASGHGVRTSPPREVTSRFDSGRSAAMTCKTRGGYREWSDRMPTGAIPERSVGRAGAASMT
jgi:hypothetical protein